MPFSTRLEMEIRDLAYDELNRVTFETPEDFDDFCHSIIGLIDSSVHLPIAPKYAEACQALQDLIEDNEALVPAIIKQVHKVQLGKQDRITPWTYIPAFMPIKKVNVKEEAQNEYRRLIINVLKTDIQKKMQMTATEKKDFIAQQKKQYAERQAEQKKLKEHKATPSVITEKEWLINEQIRFNLEAGSPPSSDPSLDYEEVFSIDQTFLREQKIEQNAIRRLKDLIEEGLLTVEDAKKLGRSGSHFADRPKIRALIRAHKLAIPQLLTLLNCDYQKKNVLAAQPLIMSGHAKIRDILELKREERANLKNAQVQTLVQAGVLRLPEAIRLTVSERELITAKNVEVIQKIHAKRSSSKINHAEINRFVKNHFQTLMVNQPEIKFSEKAFAPSHLTPQKQLFSQDPLVRALIEEKKLTFAEIDTLWPIHFPKILAAQPFLLQGKLNLTQIKELSGEECNNLRSPAIRRLFQEGWMTLKQARKLTKTQRESIEAGRQDEVIYEINSISPLAGPFSLRL